MESSSGTDNDMDGCLLENKGYGASVESISKCGYPIVCALFRANGVKARTWTLVLNDLLDITGHLLVARPARVLSSVKEQEHSSTDQP